jgi:opacity protein-like surface antigen
MRLPILLKTARKAAAALLAAALLITVSAPALAAAGPVVPITDLVEHMKRFDGKEVTIIGQAIGERMVRGDYAWITLDDDPYSNRSIEEGAALIGMSNVSMSVWVLKPETDLISYYGGYKNKGSRVRVTGVFHRACKEHGGDTDIHASSLEVLHQGHPFGHGFQYWKLLVVIFLSIAIVLLWNVRRNRIKRAGRRL